MGRSAHSPAFPYLSSYGNHDGWKKFSDNCCWEIDRSARAVFHYHEHFPCFGQTGAGMVCTYKGFTSVFVGAGTVGCSSHEFVKWAFARFPAKWRTCTFHKNQHDYQIGGKDNEAGWEVYEECRRAGAIIHTGHEHSYARTKNMAGYEDHDVEDANVGTADKPILLQEETAVPQQPGLNLAFVSGVAGRGVRPMRDGNPDQDPWWGQALASNSPDPLKPGALFCTFNTMNRDRLASCEFKQIDGVVRDSFYIQTQVPVTEPVLPPASSITPLQVRRQVTDPTRECLVQSTGKDYVGRFQMPFDHKVLSGRYAVASSLLRFSLSTALPDYTQLEIRLGATYGMDLECTDALLDEAHDGSNYRIWMGDSVSWQWATTQTGADGVYESVDFGDLLTGLLARLKSGKMHTAADDDSFGFLLHIRVKQSPQATPLPIIKYADSCCQAAMMAVTMSKLSPSTDGSKDSGSSGGSSTAVAILVVLLVAVVVAVGIRIAWKARQTPPADNFEAFEDELTEMNLPHHTDRRLLNDDDGL